MESNFSITQMISESESSAQDEYGNDVHIDAEHNFTRLTNLVRSQYFEYLKKVVDQNYMECLKAQNSYNGNNIAAEHLDECAIKLEERAVKCCMVVQLYRKAMLRIIAGIRRDTLHGRLISKLKRTDMNPIKREPVTNLNGIPLNSEIVQNCSSQYALSKLESKKNDRCLGGSYTPPRPIDVKLTEPPSMENSSNNGNESTQNIFLGVGLKKNNRPRVNHTAIVFDQALDDCKLISIDHQISDSTFDDCSYDRNIENTNLKYVHHAELQFDENYENSCYESHNLSLQSVPFVSSNFNGNVSPEDRMPHQTIAAMSLQKEPSLSHSNEHLYKEETAVDDEIGQNDHTTNSIYNTLQNNQSETTSSNAGLTEMGYEFLSLQEKIQHFQDILDGKENKRVAHKRKRSPVPITYRKNYRKLSTPEPLSPVSTSSEEEPNLPEHACVSDSLDKDLENLFGEDGKNESDDIFGDGSYNPHTDIILRQIENSELPGCGADISNKNPINKSRAKEKKTKSYKLKALITDMRDSLWPCEHYKWKQTLRGTLGEMAEVDIRRHEHIRLRFQQLFGEDSEDEFEPYSPTLELDDILISSCMKRIAPIIVKYLMIPMKNGLIVDRALFKKLAKKLAYNIVLENQYADELYIKERVELVFLFKRRIRSIADLDIT